MSLVEIIGAIFAGLSGLITALAGYNFTKNRQLASSHKDMVRQFSSIRKEIDVLRQLDIVKTRWIFATMRANAAGQPGPEYPTQEIEILEARMVEIEESGIELAKVDADVQ